MNDVITHGSAGAEMFQYHRKAKNDAIRNGATVVLRIEKGEKVVYPKMFK